VDFVNGGGGGGRAAAGGVRKSLKVLEVKVKVILSVFWCRLGNISIKFRLKNESRAKRARTI